LDTAEQSPEQYYFELHGGVGGSQVVRVDLPVIGSQWSAAVGIGRYSESIPDSARAESATAQSIMRQECSSEASNASAAVKKNGGHLAEWTTKLYHWGQKFSRFGTLAFDESADVAHQPYPINAKSSIFYA
jgi:hypothetical protein